MWHNSMSTGANAHRWRLVMRAGTVLLIVLMSCSSLSAYSVLTHKEIVDLLWTDEIRPLLLKRYAVLAIVTRPRPSFSGDGDIRQKQINFSFTSCQNPWRVLYSLPRSPCPVLLRQFDSRVVRSFIILHHQAHGIALVSEP
jgi:hypothetical protein